MTSKDDGSGEDISCRIQETMIRQLNYVLQGEKVTHKKCLCYLRKHS